MDNRTLAKFVNPSNLARATKPGAKYATVTRLSRLSANVQSSHQSTWEPLESRTMMSAVHALPAPKHPVAPPAKITVKPAAKTAVKAAVTTLAVPGTMSIAAQSPTSIKVGWADTDTNATGYKLLRSTNGTTFTQVSQIASRTTLSYTDTTVSSNTTYSYEVQAYNATLSSANSAMVTIKTPLVAPSGLTAAAKSGTSIALSWKDNDASAGGYSLLRSTDGVHFTLVSNITNGSAVTFTDITVTSGKKFTYEIQAYKSTNTSAVSATASATTSLAAPTGLAVAVQSASSINLTWTDKDSSATGYLVLRSTDGIHFTTLSTLTSGTANSFNDKTPAAFTTYYYEVEATTSTIASPASNIASGTTPLATPVIATAVATGSTSVKLTFSDKDPNAKGYIFLRSTGGGSYTQVGLSLVPSTTAWTDNNVVSNTTYSYEIKAANGSNYSAASTPVTVTTGVSAPVSLTATVVNGTVKLTWTDTASSATQYLIYRAVNGGGLVSLATITSGTATTYTDSTVTSGHTYNYDVVAVAGKNSSAASNTATAAAPLAAPTGLNANATTGTSVVLTWTDHDTTATGYNILRSTDGINFTLLTKATGATLATYTDTTASSAHTYYYQVQAYNTYATSTVTSSVTVTTPLLAPTTLTATVVGTNVNLGWTDKDALATGYNILRSTDGINFAQLTQLTSATANTYTDTTAASGQKYYYQVQATASTIKSPVSNTVSVTVAAAAPSKNAVTIATRNTNELVITAAGTSDNIAISQSGGTLTIVADGQTTTDPAPAAGLFVYTRGGADGISIAQSVTASTTLETIDTGIDDITSAGTNVTVWDDNTDIFTGTGTVHTVNTFAGGVSKATGASLKDPSDAGTIMHVTGSLFGTGPTASDINQGAAGDCYFLSSLAAFAGQQPGIIQQSAVDMGDGTYTVQFEANGTPQYIRVSNDISTNGGGSYKFARPGASGNLWAVIMEKAFAYFRTGANSYASLNSGWMGSVYANLGVNSTFFYLNTTTDAGLYTTLSTALNSGKEVTLGTGNAPDLVSSHAYTLISASKDANGVTTYVVRNPWGVSGDSLENSGGYATLTYAQMVANFLDCCVAT